MSSSAIEAANSAISEIFIFTYGSTDEDSPTACNKVALKTVRRTYQKFKLVANCNDFPGVNSAMRQEFYHVSIVNFEQLNYYQK